MTADRNAAIARFSGITAGAPDVVPIDEAIAAAAEELAAARCRTAISWCRSGPRCTPDAARGRTDCGVGQSGNARFHLITPGAAAELANVAVASGGLAPATTELVAAADRMLGAITDRFRAVTTVSGPGSHQVALEVGGTRYTAPIDVAPPRAVRRRPVRRRRRRPRRLHRPPPPPRRRRHVVRRARPKRRRRRRERPAPAAPVTTAASAPAEDGRGVGIIR